MPGHHIRALRYFLPALIIGRPDVDGRPRYPLSAAFSMGPVRAFRRSIQILRQILQQTLRTGRGDAGTWHPWADQRAVQPPSIGSVTPVT